MIHVFFVPGMFGSTIEHVVRSYSNELTPSVGKILPDGSMHSFRKVAHIRSLDELVRTNNSVEITTPIYPFQQHHLPEILKHFENFASEDDSYMIVHADSVESAELNMLFKYHKISVGLSRGLESFCYGNEHNIISWDPTYRHWSEMKTWQLREWISLFYVQYVQEWIDSQNQVRSNFLKIKNTDLLFNTATTFERIFAHCELTQKSGLDDFLQQWQTAQQYIVDEFRLLSQIVRACVSAEPLTWKPINIIAEAIVQQRLRSAGYEIKCDGLDTFPTDSETLYNLLEIC